jgi:hypothetical protein
MDVWFRRLYSRCSPDPPDLPYIAYMLRQTRQYSGGFFALETDPDGVQHVAREVA